MSLTKHLYRWCKAWY